MVPHSGVGCWTPKPRNPNAAVSRIAEENPSVALTINGAIQLGSTTMNISLNVTAPATRLAVT